MLFLVVENPKPEPGWTAPRVDEIFPDFGTLASLAVSYAQQAALAGCRDDVWVVPKLARRAA